MTLPILLSIPHGGTHTPPEVVGRVILSDADRFDDSDPLTRELYDLGGAVRAVVAADAARAFVDMNRAPDDRPPGNPDGVVKTTTCYGRPIYREDAAPDSSLTDLLIAAYHEPYHRALEAAARDDALRLALDCHTMASSPPTIAPDSGRSARPAFCLSNVDGATCPLELMERLARAVADAFGCRPEAIQFNDPFRGGYILRRHGRGRVPWIQVEMNRSWYLAPPWFDPDRRHVDPQRIDWLRDRFGAALAALEF